MKLSPVRVSLVALAVAMAATGARADARQPMVQLAQAEDGGASQQVLAVQKFLNGGRDLTQMDDARLQQRLNRARSLREVEGLPPDLDQALQMQIAQIEAEIARRQEATAPQPQPPVQERVETQPKIEEPPLPPAEPQQGTAVEEPPQKPAKRKQAEQAPPPDQPPDQPPPPAASAGGAPEVAAFLQSVRPAAGLDAKALQQQMDQAMALSQSPDLSRDQRRALRDVIREARAALRNTADQAAPDQAQQPPAAGQPKPVPPANQQAQQPQPPPAAPTEAQLANPKVNPALERQAQAYLNDNADVRMMKRKQLRKRLSDMRDLLASNQLSPQTREALRQKLAQERAVLRNEVAVDEGLPPPSTQPQQPQKMPGQPPPPRQNGNGSNGSVTINNNTTVSSNTELRVVLQDRRPPNELDDRELVRRIDVYRDVVADDRYDQEQRMQWRQQMEADRRYLRRQMIAERRQREARLRQGEYQFDYDVQDRYAPGYDVPDDVFAAEADDEEIAGVLAAPPRRELQRRYTLDDIERQPQLREAVARIEIDTVHFGFGEGFLREEEIDKLDRIATVLEKILARHPNEVFLIEGHTDAVGSDQANLVLSRQRAAAVKEALTTYYVIPAENLKTVGLGERYLKIPTNQPEAENRRVSLARITPLVGQAAQ